MRLTSPAFAHGGTIPVKYTCDGLNINPELHFEDVPEGAVSLVLLMDDPDVPHSLRPDGMYDHWIVYNVSPDAKTIKEGHTPPGLVGKNTSNTLAYVGPCPPDREHRYFFKLYALDINLSINGEPTKKEIEKAMKGHILAEAELMGRYDRQSNKINH